MSRQQMTSSVVNGEKKEEFTVVGAWMNKPLYRKQMEVAFSSGIQSWFIDENIEYVTFIMGIVKTDDGRMYPVNTFQTSSQYVVTQVSDGIFFYSGYGKYASGTLCLTVEFTRTTDAPLSNEGMPQ